MKAILNGLRYDTDTAELIGEDSSVWGKSDFRWFDAGLYRTRNGRFFLAGKGGPMTQFASHCGNGSTYGERIIPMTKEEAREWAENHLPVVQVYNVFADAIEDA